MHTQNIANYEHPHIFHYSGAESERRTMRVVLLTTVMMVVEIIAGSLFNSMALLADGWHMSTHVVALGISWTAFVLARRYSLDRHFVFGTWKIEILGGFVSAIFLGFVAFAMIFVSVERLFQPVAIKFNQAILVAVIGLVVNLISIFLLEDHGQEHAHESPGKEHRTNLNMRAAYLHVVADAMTSLLAIGALLGGKFMHWDWLDPLVGIAGALVIARWTYGLLRDTGNILLDREGDIKLSGEIQAAIGNDGDTRISDLHAWRVGEGKYACIISIIASNPENITTYKDRLKEIRELAHVTIEIAACDRDL